MNGVTIRSFEDIWTARADLSSGQARPRAPGAPPECIFADQAEDILEGDLAQAEKIGREMLKAHPCDPDAKYLLGASLRRQGHYEEARDVLSDLTRSQPQVGAAWRELGFTLQKLGGREDAIEAFRNTIDCIPVDKGSWREMGKLLFAEDDRDRSGDDPRLVKARKAYREERYDEAEAILRPLLDEEPENVRALKLYGDILLGDKKRWNDARPVLERCVSLAPEFTAARFRLASMLLACNDYGVAFQQIGHLLRQDPGNSLYKYMQAIVLGGGIQFSRALPLYEELLAEFPDRIGLWTQYIQLVRFVRPPDAVRICEDMLRRFPNQTEFYYNIATVKTFRFDESWIQRMLSALERPDLRAQARVQLHFVVGKAFEDMKQYDRAFHHYKASNDILFENKKIDHEERTNFKWRSKQVYTRRFFRTRVGAGCQESGPILIVGMPRAGSTLVDQILSSHSAIEGLDELEDLPRLIAQELEKDRRTDYPHNVARLNAERLRWLGEQYMTKTRRRRKTSKPFFTDKAPSNFLHVGLIQLILPNAKIIDARRHPMDCCFSCYKHYFPSGWPITWDLRTVGQAYVDYVELMAHFDQVLPGRVHRVIYENMVQNPEEEIRRLLNYVGVPFEEQCLRFHETDRFVRTISAEQVRMPMYKSGIAFWKHYERWLGPLKEELGGVLECYPEIPEFFPRLRSQSSSWELGTANEFDLVTGIRQPPFESVPLPA